jgi:hypothetical protein
MNVGVDVEIGVGVSVGVLVDVEVMVRLACGVPNQPPFLLLKEMMKTLRMIIRIAMVPKMVLDFIRFS